MLTARDAAADTAATSAALEVARQSAVATASNAVVTSDNLDKAAIAAREGSTLALTAANGVASDAQLALQMNLAGIAPAQVALEVKQAALAVLNRQDTLLTDAANRTQENITLASGALTGAPAAADVNFETEALGALTDHENRIVTNSADIATLGTGLIAEAAARISGDAATLVARIHTPTMN